MSESHTRAIRLEATSARSRLVEMAATAVAACDCPGPHSVAVLRGFGHSARAEAASLRRRLSQEGLVAREVPLKVAVAYWGEGGSPPASGPPCVLVDASTRGTASEAVRAAALAGVPIITVAGADARPGSGVVQTEYVTALRAHLRDPETSAAPTFPSAAGAITEIALREIRLLPNQPETGELRLRLATGMPTTLRPGAEVSLLPLPDAISVEVVEPQREVRVWFAPRVVLEQLSGQHIVCRDGLRITDLTVLAVELMSHPVVKHAV